MSGLREIFGQDRAVEWLREAHRADRLPHGLIFAGPKGVGKATTARALAQLWLCEAPRKDEPCGRCQSCIAVAADNHPDYHVITKELIRHHDKTGKSKGVDLSIHVIRPELIEPAGRKSGLGRGKVFIVEQAELMSVAAQNALLKTLEEPSGRTLIILLTDQPGVLLPTVRSRCQTLHFTALDEAVVRDELIRRGTDRTLAADAARLSPGSLGVAIKWIEDQVIVPAKELLEQIDQLFAGCPPEDLPGWFRKAADAYAEKQLKRDELASKDQATREGLALYLQLAGEHVRQRLAHLSNASDLEIACDAIEAFVQAETYLDANVNIPVIFQNLAVSLERSTGASAPGY